MLGGGWRSLGTALVALGAGALLRAGTWGGRSASPGAHLLLRGHGGAAGSQCGRGGGGWGLEALPIAKLRSLLMVSLLSLLRGAPGVLS